MKRIAPNNANDDWIRIKVLDQLPLIALKVEVFALSVPSISPYV